jgi:hypothetical protein
VEPKVIAAAKDLLLAATWFQQVPQEWLLHEPHPLFFFGAEELAIPCPTSGVLPPEITNAFQMRLRSSLPHSTQTGLLSSIIERSRVTTLSQPLQR